MSRVEITAEMVWRATASYRALTGNRGISDEEMVRILDDALNPPADEIEVTQAMIDAGNESVRVHIAEAVRDPPPRMERLSYVATIYRAMHAARPKELVPLLVCAKCGSHHIESERRKTMSNAELYRAYVAKRRDDPK